MGNGLGLSRKEKFMEVDTNRENLYNICKNNSLTLRELSAIMNLGMFKVKAYAAELVKNKHLEKYNVGTSANNKPIVKFKSTEIVYKARTSEELDKQFQSSKDKGKEVKRGMYDDLIEANPNLRKFHGKTSLMETKQTSDFLSGQRGKVNRSVSSCWGMYDSI